MTSVGRRAEPVRGREENNKIHEKRLPFIGHKRELGKICTWAEVFHDAIRAMIVPLHKLDQGFEQHRWSQLKQQMKFS